MSDFLQHSVFFALRTDDLIPVLACGLLQSVDEVFLRLELALLVLEEGGCGGVLSLELVETLLIVFGGLLEGGFLVGSRVLDFLDPSAFLV